MIDRICAAGIVPVVVIDREEDAPELAGALVGGGLPIAEVTFRTDAAAGAIRRMKEACPGMLVGAGTIMTPEQVQEAVSAGAAFIVTPGMNEPVVRFCVEEGIPVIPGVMDTYAIERAIRFGLETLKFFPAEAAGGTRMIKALAGPYQKLRFLPTGGIHEENMKEYLALPNVPAVGGSWICSKSLIREGRWEEIREITGRAVALARAARSGR